MRTHGQRGPDPGLFSCQPPPCFLPRPPFNSGFALPADSSLKIPILSYGILVTVRMARILFGGVCDVARKASSRGPSTKEESPATSRGKRLRGTQRQAGGSWLPWPCPWAKSWYSSTLEGVGQSLRHGKRWRWMPIFSQGYVSACQSTPVFNITLAHNPIGEAKKR